MKIHHYKTSFIATFFGVMLAYNQSAQAFEEIFIQQSNSYYKHIICMSLAAFTTAFIFLLRKYKKEPLSRDKLRPLLKRLGFVMAVTLLMMFFQPLFYS